MAPALVAWAALALVLGFSVVIARAVAAGSTVTCACFGAGAARGEEARPVSVVELVRNAGLGGLAIVASGSAAGTVDTNLPCLVIVSVLVALSRVAFAAVDLRRDGGHVFSTPLAGELRPMTGDVWIVSYVLLWLAVLGLSVMVVALLRQVGVLHTRLRPFGRALRG